MENTRCFSTQNHDAHIFSHMAFISQEWYKVNPAVYAGIQAHVVNTFHLKARAQVLQMIQNRKARTYATSRKRPRTISN